ncbi:MAG TPA: cytochrome P450 [Candidatus Dormibacteraeota bacterium]|nr:cytochrome P450 [Candidatus Dormibacteraeota bacterium]
MRPGELDLSDAAVFENGAPIEYFKMLRREAPVCWHEEKSGSGHWAVTRYDDLKFVSRNPLTFSSWKGGTILRELTEQQTEGNRALMINMDPPQHVKYRRLVQRGFTPRMVRDLEPHVRRMATEIVDRVAARGECEFVSEVSAVLPMQVICQMMGVAREDWEPVYDLSNKLVGFDDPEFQKHYGDGEILAMQMFQYAARLNEKVRNQPGDDLGTALVQGDVDGEKLTDLEFNSFFMLLAVAGNETTRTATSHGVMLLAQHPEQRARVLKDPKLLPLMIEEVLRLASPLHYFRRTALQDTELNGARIKAGDKVTLWYPSANRDEAVFKDAETFDVGRTPNDHLAFGIGEHFCLGASLARLELNILFEELLRRLPDISLDGPPVRLRSNFVHGIKSMPVRFTPEGRGATVAVS